MTTTLRIGEPARVANWGLATNRTDRPTDAILVQYATPGRRHTEPFSVVARLPYSDSVTTLADALVRLHVPAGLATQLVVQLGMRLASRKALNADMGYRPVS